MSAPKYPPKVEYYSGIPKLFEEIKKAPVPPKFTLDFMSSILGLKSSSYRAMIPLLKGLNFIDPNNIPTIAYKNYRDDNLSQKVMAEIIKNAYQDLYKINEYAHTLDKKTLITKLTTFYGTSKEDLQVIKVADTFLKLCKLADFENINIPDSKGIIETEQIIDENNTNKFATPENIPSQRNISKLGLSYTINLNLPATSDINVFNAIFKSLKENIINEL